MLMNQLQNEPYMVLGMLLKTGNFPNRLTSKESPSQILLTAHAFLYKIRPHYASWEDIGEKLSYKVGNNHDLGLFLLHEINSHKYDIPCSSDGAYNEWKNLYEDNIHNWRILNHNKWLWADWKCFSDIVNEWRIGKGFDTIGAGEKIIGWFLDNTSKVYGIKLKYTQEELDGAKVQKKMMEWQKRQLSYSKPVDFSDFDAARIWNEHEKSR